MRGWGLMETNIAQLEVLAPKPGVYKGVPMSVYRAIPALNHSLLRHMRRSPAHLQHARAHPMEQTPAMALGTALHVWALQRDLWDAEVCVAPDCDKRTKAGKQEWEEFVASSDGKTVITAEQNLLVRPMSKAIGGHPDAARLRSAKGDSEVVIMWNDQDGLLCKGRIDKTIETVEGWIRVDVKTTRCSDIGSFRRDIHTFGYHTQDAFYRRGLEVLGIKDAGEYIIAVETEPPHPVEVITLGAKTRYTADALVTAWIAEYAKCYREKHWPLRVSGVQEVDIPEWALMPEEIEV